MNTQPAPANTVQTAISGMIAAKERRLPWDVMGSALHTDYSTVGEALTDRNLDFTVDMEPVRTESGLLIPGSKAAVRPFQDGTRGAVGVMGNRYTPIPNAEAFSVADILTAEFGATISGAADFRGGGASLLVVTMPDTITLDTPNGERDITNLNLVMKNAHDGSASLTFALTATRLACTNALQAAIKGAARSWKIMHTPNAQSRVDMAHQAIIAAMNYQDAFQAKAQAMMDQTMMDAEFNKIVAQLWPVDDEETKAGQNRLEVREEVKNLYFTSDTLENERGTLWGGYNAITEWVDWGRPVRNGDIQRAQGTLEGAPVRMKESVWNMFAGAVA